MTGPSFWHDALPHPIAPRPALPGDSEADIVIVGAGYTGLWTAYYLKKADPSCRIVVLESEYAGFGASGRNGGWCSGLFPSSLAKVAKVAGSREAASALQRKLNETVDEVGAVAASREPATFATLARLEGKRPEHQPPLRPEAPKPAYWDSRTTMRSEGSAFLR